MKKIALFAAALAILTIEGLGYAATFASGNDSSSTPEHPERVTLFEVPLACCAAEGLGCGSRSKPILAELEQDSMVAEAQIDYSGTLLAIVWKDQAQIQSGLTAVNATLEKHDIEASVLQGRKRKQALKKLQSERWYGPGEVDRLSEREAQVIAARLVGRAKEHLGLTPDRMAALTADLAAVIARHLISNSDMNSPTDREAMELDFANVASRYLDPAEMAELRKAAEKGIDALPGEVK